MIARLGNCGCHLEQNWLRLLVTLFRLDHDDDDGNLDDDGDVDDNDDDDGDVREANAEAVGVGVEGGGGDGDVDDGDQPSLLTIFVIFADVAQFSHFKSKDGPSRPLAHISQI